MAVTGVVHQRIVIYLSSRRQIGICNHIKSQLQVENTAKFHLGNCFFIFVINLNKAGPLTNMLTSYDDDTSSEMGSKIFLKFLIVLTTLLNNFQNTATKMVYSKRSKKIVFFTKEYLGV